MISNLLKPLTAALLLAVCSVPVTAAPQSSRPGSPDAGEGEPGGLAACGLGQEVVVLGEQHSSQSRGPVKDLGIGQSPAAILLDREDIDAAKAQPGWNGPVDVLVEIEGQAQARRSRFRIFSAKGEETVSRRASSTNRDRRSMSASSSA